MDLTTGIVFGEDYYGDEVNELAVASFNYVKQDITDVKKRYMSLGFHLHEMEMYRYHEELGYDNFYECIEKNFHMDKSAVSRVIAVWNEFCSKDDSNSKKMWVDDKYEKYSYSQLVEMLPLKEKERFKVNADMTVSQIRSYKRSLKEKAKEQKSSTDILNTSDTLVQTSKKKKSVATSQPVPEKKVLPYERGCITGKSPNGTCVCCGCNETVECCADCKEDCNGKCGWIEDKEPVITQPELPVMKNMAQREEFINSYKSWNIWCRNECTEETFYRYDLPDGYAIVVKNYPYYIEWTKEESETEEYYLLDSGYRHFADCKTNMTVLKEHLKKHEQEITTCLHGSSTTVASKQCRQSAPGNGNQKKEAL